MRISELRAMGLACPNSYLDDEFVWDFLETDCPQVALRGFDEGPGAFIEGRLFGDCDLLVVETPFFMEGLEDVFMGERVRVSRDGDRYVLEEIVRPLRYAHYESTGFDRDSYMHSLVMGLGGNWERWHFSTMFIHIPIASAAVFESMATTKLERIA